MRGSSQWPLIATLVAAWATALPGCAQRTTAVRFRGPVVSSVKASPMPASLARARSRPRAPEADAEMNAGAARSADADPAPRPAHRPTVRAIAPSQRRPAGVADRATETAEGFAGPADGLADRLRSRVGERDDAATGVEWAVAALGRLDVELAVDVRTEAELLAAAEQRDALSRLPLPGDLVRFADPADDWSAIGVIVANHERHLDRQAITAVEFVYLSRDVVRRGYLTPTAPRAQRDDQGRPLNTFVRHQDSRTPNGAGFLAGELFATYIRADRLSSR